MSAGFWRLVAALTVATVVMLGAAWCVEGCVAAKPAAETAYLAEQILCIDEAETKAAADACRNAVKAKWAKDGGIE